MAKAPLNPRKSQANKKPSSASAGRTVRAEPAQAEAAPLAQGQGKAGKNEHSAHAGQTGMMVLGNQLFAPSKLKAHGVTVVFMREDYELCTYFRFHQTKLVFYLAAMRAYATELSAAGIAVHYEELAKSKEPYEHHLLAWANKEKLARLLLWDVEDAWFRARIKEALEVLTIPCETLESPLFLTTVAQFADYTKRHKRPFMRLFYQEQRRRLNMLLTVDGQPKGGKWSFDEDNRKPLGKDVALPDISWPKAPPELAAVMKLVKEAFPDHPRAPEGSKEATTFWLPVTRTAARAWLQEFLQRRFTLFGPYEDALSKRGDVLFHSVLSPLMNVGLLSPDEVVGNALKHADAHNVPQASVEGFVRQIIGWREFIRGIDRQFGKPQQERNHFGHTRKLSAAWYEGNSGIVPLDDVVNKVGRLGWAHHIERLMVVGNLMLLCEIEPKQAFAWFMEMFVDSSDWVMGPNVYGMALFSDGGIFATKPYICGANYLRKMGGYKKGPWCDAVDGLYWRFVRRHAKQFQGNPRMQMMVRNAEKITEERQERIYAAADAALKRLTEA